MNILRWMLVILFGLLIIVVVVQNHEPMSTAIKFRVNLMLFKGETAAMSLYLVAVITFCVGVILTGLYGITERFHLKRQIKELMREAKQKDNELNSLRNLPVTSEDMSSDRFSEEK